MKGVCVEFPEPCMELRFELEPSLFAVALKLYADGLEDLSLTLFEFDLRFNGPLVSKPLGLMTSALLGLDAFMGAI
jgi:hypothetical protein